MASISTEVYVGYVDVEVELEDFDTEDLIEELERRGKSAADYGYANRLLRDLYEKRRNGQDYQWELDQIIHETIGRF